MISVVFPVSLPNPSASAVSPSERRLLSDVTGGPQQARGVQRDYLAVRQVTWSHLNATEAAMFDAWYRNTLSNGGAWFSAAWPSPQGSVLLVHRFLSAPRWTYQAGGFWGVAADLQVRGRGLPPSAKYRGELLLHYDEAGRSAWRDFSIHRRALSFVEPTPSAITANPSGVFNGCASFSQAFPGSGGVPDYNTQAYVLTDGTLNLSNDEFFMEVRVYLASSPGTGQFTIASNIEPQLDGVSIKSAGWQWFIEDVTGAVRHRFTCTTPGSAFGAAAGTIPLNQWVTLSVSRTNTTQSILDATVNGDATSGTANNYPLALTADASSRGVYVGAWDRTTFGGPNVVHGFQGKMDELFVDVGAGTGVRGSYAVSGQPY